MIEGDLNKNLSKNATSLLSGLGNCSYLFAHIEYFENKLSTEIAPYKQNPGSPYLEKWAYQNCPNFITWIRLYPEFICNRAMASLSLSEKCKTRLTEYNFSNAANKIFKQVRDSHDSNKISKDRLEEMIKAFKLTIELRHTIQHGGLPSVLRTAASFDGVDLEEIAEMANPLRYRETKKIFSDANELLSLLPKPMIIGKADGSIEVQDEKDSKMIYRSGKG